MKLLAIDYGKRRIGLAATSGEGTVRGLSTIDRHKHPDAVAATTAAIRRESPDRLIMGIPLDGTDRETPFAVEIKAFAGALSKSTGLTVSFIDESFTSTRAQELLRFRRKKERRDKSNVDRLAACIILEDFLKEHPCD
jgi:putative holliday junction resolvase